MALFHVPWRYFLVLFPGAILINLPKLVNWVQIGPKMAFSEAKNLINFAKIFVIFSRLRKIENCKFSENYENIVSNSNFYFHEKTAPTQIPTRIFDFKFRMQGLKLNIFNIDLRFVYCCFRFNDHPRRLLMIFLTSR